MRIRQVIESMYRLQLENKLCQGSMGREGKGIDLTHLETQREQMEMLNEVHTQKVKPEQSCPRQEMNSFAKHGLQA